MFKQLFLKTGILFFLLCKSAVFSQNPVNQAQKIILNNNWFVQQSSKINLTGAEISGRSINKSGWFATKVPATIMGALTANGLYKNAFYGDEFKLIDKKQFDESWWYCTQFELPLVSNNQHITLNLDGINYYANIWLNGKLIASRDSVFGTFRRFEFEITKFVKQANNILAVEIFKAQPGDLNLGFVDWNPRPPDENMGIWRGVYLKISGDVSLKNTYVESKVNTITLAEASLTIKTSLQNNSAEARHGIVKGEIESTQFSYPFDIKPGESIDLTLTEKQIPELSIQHPRLWWCNNLGLPELYNLNLQVEIADRISDSEKITFGIRQIESYTNKAGHKGFKLNGKELLIKGAGWTDDIFLRDSLASLETQIQYVKHMNLNTIRFESIWGNSQDIYDLCDRYGILSMVGWSCQWEWDEYLGKPCDEFGGIKTEKDMTLAINSFRDQVLWLRNHPGIFVWMVGSDKCPRPELETRYAKLFKSLDNRPYLSTAGTRVCEVSGPSGVKMNGPYEYVSPNYWYLDTINGGAFGFNTETGPGPQVPKLESLKKMIPGNKLWPPNEIWNYHCTHSKEAFNKMNVFNAALEARYGNSENLENYLLKSDAQSYEALKAMFEAFRVKIPKTTGIIQWMLNSAWPSTYWQLYDYYLIPTSAYYAARKANEPVQLIYDYAENAVYVVNETHKELFNCTASVKIYDSLSAEVLNLTMPLTSQPLTSEKIVTLDSLRGTIFLDFKLLSSDGKEVATNFYWLNGKPDVPDWDKTTWAYTPMKSYTSFEQLNYLQQTEVKLNHQLQMNGDKYELKVQLINVSDKIAFMLDISLTNEKGETIIPAFWSDNYFSLMPGEEREISCSLPSAAVENKSIKLNLNSWNTRAMRFDVK